MSVPAPSRRWTRRCATLLTVGLVLAASPGVTAAAVLAWREGATLHLTNDPTTAPADGVQRFESRRAIAPAAATPPGDQTSPCPIAGSAPPSVLRASADAPYAARVAMPPLVIAPTIVVRAPATQVTVVSGGSSGYGYGYGYGAPAFLPTGFIGHEHPQVPFLAGRRLVPHSHFFARGRAGFFTPWGHFSQHGLLATSIPSW